MSKKEKYLLVILGMIIVITVGITAVKEQKSTEEIYVIRPEQGSDTRSFLFRLNGQEKEYEIPVYAKEKTEEEKEEAFRQIIQYIDEMICGENTSLTCVTQTLILPESVPEYYATIRWKSQQTDIIGEDGRVHRDKVKEATTVELTAKITIGSEKKEKVYAVIVLPYERGSIEEKLIAARDYLLAKEQNSRFEDSVTFPTWIGNVEISEQENAGYNQWLLLLFPITIICVVLGKKKEAEKEKKEQERELLVAYPNLVTKLTMYIGAGMTIRTAWERLAKEYEGSIQSYLGKAICQTVAELHTGKPEEVAYEKFGEQIGLRPYKRLAAILAGKSSRGGGIKEALRREVQEAWEVQKEEVKRRGNEAETKLIIPMLGMMIIVFSIVVIPAFFSLSF